MINTSKEFPENAHSFMCVFEPHEDEGDVSYKSYWHDEVTGKLMGGWLAEDIHFVNKDEDLGYFKNECADYFFISRS